MKLLILDGNSILNRAFYGVHPLTTREGLHTNAIFGFLNILQKLRDEEKPDALCVAFDLHGPTFRHEQYELYKANRKGMPEELAEQMPIMKEVLAAMNIPVYGLQGWEADDVIGTVSRICAEKGVKCVIATGDRDSLQLVSDSTTVRLAVSKGGQTSYTAYTPAVFREEYGFDPIHLIDLKALMGDSSDNIPGVAGIGPKTAKELLWKYGTLVGVYEAVGGGEIRASVEEKLKNSREEAYLSYDLATIRLNAPLDFSPEENLLRPWDEAKLYELFLRLEFLQFIERYHLRKAEIPAQRTGKYECVRIAALDEGNALLRNLSGKTVAAYLEEGAFAICDGEKVYAFYEEDLFGAFAELQNALFSASVKLIVHDLKPLLRALLSEKIYSENFCFDTALAAYLLDATQGDYSLSRVSVRYLGTECEDNPENRAQTVYALYKCLSEKLETEGLHELYYETELPLCAVLADMEHTGVLVDRMALLSFGNMLSGRITETEALIYRYAGETFNINSTKQLGVLLFEKLGLPPVKKTKTGYSTGAEILDKLKNQHPIIPAILEYRMLTKLNSTYAEGLMKVICEDDRIRTTFQNTVTATGRLSSTDPNLQNIPVRTEMGSEIRKMFIARPGWVLVDADYSQIELRVLAHIADDKAMQEAFCSGADFHSATAAQVFDVPVEEVTPQMRRSAKAVNFGIVYGISEFSLSEDLGVTRKEAKQYIENYLARFSGVKTYMHDVIENARKLGYTQTLFGRRRYIPELTASNHMVKAAAERIALNAPIQGTAADIMKIATLRAYRALKEAKLKAKIVLQVHDELIVECPAEEAEKVKALITREMSAAAALLVPLKAEANFGESWYAAK